MVTPNPDIVTRMELRATLAYDDSTRPDDFTSIALHAQSLGMRVTPVSGAAARFLMCHESISLCRNTGNLNLGVILPMPLLFPIMLAAAHFEYAYLVMPPVTDHSRADFCLIE